MMSAAAPAGCCKNNDVPQKIMISKKEEKLGSVFPGFSSFLVQRTGFKALLQLRQPRNGKALSHWDTKKQPVGLTGCFSL
jgi:hypothetical protein